MNRCEECKKKIGIYGFTCKCEKYFCTVHRFPDTHHCTFDWKTYDKQDLCKKLFIPSKV